MSGGLLRAAPWPRGGACCFPCPWPQGGPAASRVHSPSKHPRVNWQYTSPPPSPQPLRLLKHGTHTATGSSSSRRSGGGNIITRRPPQHVWLAKLRISSGQFPKTTSESPSQPFGACSVRSGTAGLWAGLTELRVLRAREALVIRPRSSWMPGLLLDLGAGGAAPNVLRGALRLPPGPLSGS